MPKGDTAIESAGKGLLPGGALVLAVLAVLGFAAARQIDPAAVVRQPAPPPASEPVPAPVPSSEPAWNPARVATDPTMPVLDPLARRTLEDPARITRSGEYTLQIAVACRKETALGLLERANSAADLYVLPATSQGQECYRFCWGTFDTREQAARAVLPSSLKAADLGTPGPRRIHELTP